MSSEDLEISADWLGPEGDFIKALREVRYLDGEEGGYRMHDWADHNPWAAGAEKRSEKASWAALCKQHGRAEAARMMPDYAARMDQARQQAGEAPGKDASGLQNSAGSTAPGKQAAVPNSATSTQVAVPDAATGMRQAQSSCAPSPSPSLNSVPDGTDGAAVAKSVAEMDKDELWKAGKSLLEQSGMPKAQCGAFVGKLVKDYGNEVVVTAVRSAVVERPADPASFLKAACQQATGQRQQARQGVQAQGKHTGFTEDYYADAGGF